MKSISGKQLCKIVERKGWHLQRINGSHFIYKKEGVKDLLVIPVHKNEDLKPGLLKAIMKLVELTEKDLR